MKKQVDPFADGLGKPVNVPVPVGGGNPLFVELTNGVGEPLNVPLLVGVGKPFVPLALGLGKPLVPMAVGVGKTPLVSLAEGVGYQLDAPVPGVGDRVRERLLGSLVSVKSEE